MPDDLKAQWMALGDKLYERARRQMAERVAEVLGTEPDDELAARGGKTKGKGGKKEKPVDMPSQVAPEDNRIIFPPEELKEKGFDRLGERQVNMDELRIVLKVGKIAHNEAELASLEGGECVAIHNNKRIIFNPNKK